MEALLKDESAPNDHSNSLYWVLTLMLNLHGGSPERRKRSWQPHRQPTSGPHRQPISGPHTDSYV